MTTEGKMDTLMDAVAVLKLAQEVRNAKPHDAFGVLQVGVRAAEQAARKAALEEARKAGCEYREPCDGETLREFGAQWCDYCLAVRALAQKEDGRGE